MTILQALGSVDTLSLFLVLLISSGIVYRGRRNSSLPHPPGPTRLPLIGNLLDLPKKEEWLHWAKYKALYGPISSVSFLGFNIVILNDLPTVHELLEVRSSIYSDRPRLRFGGEMCLIDKTLGLMPYGDSFRRTRRIASQSISSRATVVAHRPLIEVEVRRTLLRVLRQPGKTIEHVRTAAAAIILNISYGYTIEPRKPDPLAHLADEAIDKFNLASKMGRWAVDFIPAMRYIPEWMPGGGFKKVAREIAKLTTDAVEIPFDFAKRKINAGMAAPSFVSTLLQDSSNTESEYTMKWFVTSLYIAGVDTTVATIWTFILAMLHYPEALSQAQMELDSVVGKERLPTYSDRQDLPYVDALIKEVMRWGTVIPLALPHAASTDDVYNGYFIPRGAIVFPNIWQIHHDPDNFRDPHKFFPERFLSEDKSMAKLDPRDTFFGFGRRACVGKELADTSLFVLVALLLATFDIRPSTDVEGRDVLPPLETTSGIVVHPKDFDFEITPRSSKAVQLIEAIEDEHPFETGDAQALRWI